MSIASANPGWTDDLPTAAEARAQRTLQAAERLLAEPTPSAPASAEHQLREYMQEMSLTRYGHASALLSRLYGKSR
ncbi:hypothetical protein [Bordetella genomosp. 4]|uniref:Uncharacterized protein n=1 Tax=Bordetella genomosp. 4 TaxID=463044 RepID=A0A261U4E6_9BORD|nr:hypothetical protein [Bordetella genomosp. 4]OZI48768.1 hypothetical protein CAL21_13120 [Bordetella genomosp. 4]OZI56826.1 hypothetical protein CAL20_15645 [Bordetella genomosp. 4]